MPTIESDLQFIMGLLARLRPRSKSQLSCSSAPVDGLSLDPGAGEIDGVFDVAVGMQGLGKAREARCRLSPGLDREHLGAALGSAHRRVPVSTISASRLPHREHTSRARQSRTNVSVAGPGPHLVPDQAQAMAATPAADDDSDPVRRCVAERHRRARLGPHRRRWPARGGLYTLGSGTGSRTGGGSTFPASLRSAIAALMTLDRSERQENVRVHRVSTACPKFRRVSASFTVFGQIPECAKRPKMAENMAHPARFELTTSAFGGQRSIQLSYGCR